MLYQKTIFAKSKRSLILKSHVIMKKLLLMTALFCFAAAPVALAQEPVTVPQNQVTVPQTQSVNDLKKQQEQ